MKRDGDNDNSNNDGVAIINNPVTTNVYSVYLHTEISDMKNYIELFNRLREADKDDKFIIYINNFGGYLHTGLDIINAMRACNGEVYTCVTGPCYSMAPLIALSGTKVFVEQDTFFMFHDYSGGTIGKGSEIQAQIKNEKPHFDNMFRRITKGFLTDEEARNILRGEDCYINNKKLLGRLKKMKRLGNGSGIGENK